MEQNFSQYEPSTFFTWSVHLDGDKEMHDASVCQPGVYDRAVAAIEHAKEHCFRVNIDCTLFNNAQANRVADFFDAVMELGVDGITVSPRYAYERAPDQQHFLNRGRTKQLFRDVFRRGGDENGLLANRAFSSTFFFWPAISVTTARHGKPDAKHLWVAEALYLVGEGYAKTFDELMTDTDWESYGTGNYEKCADCMVGG